MLTEARRQELSDLLRPVSPPRVLENVYTDDQRERLLDVVRQQGPWKLIIAQHFASAEELIATGSGGVPEGVTPTLDMFLTPTFRGFYANYSALLYPQIHDCFYNATFLELAKSYWGAKYAKPQMMLFNVNGPCGNTDPGHLDSPSFRGIRYENSPTWLCSVMGKSGLFKDYLIKSAQVITWFSPVYNRGVVVQNEMLMHRGEANGAPEQQRPAGLDFTTTFSGDCADRDHWLLKTGDRVIARHHTNELRFLVHWTAEVFEDYDELKKNMEGTHNLTHEQAIDTLIKDVRSRGIRIETPSDPLHDPQFIRALNSAYDIGAPASYPEGAPVTPIYTQAA